ncbi:hypothetical protein JCM21714_2261 [Gracilibacillus boraciitolerans JCM 21714]|uniref:Uncharacterized protein n=1 Tax=Gracilibacillus boraciitolerans JCM 21714 TaxID=1298598 RepID=W4VJ17_9BACI|nr:hypothetical protein [Gracilibacillus boraciitolerans]GAE93207.1 hypothetical protein JCM21714_2261 [Gracilibacillus boraciitolerans JCM 21714]
MGEAQPDPSQEQSKQESPEEGNNKKETEDLETAPPLKKYQKIKKQKLRAKWLK